MQVKLTPLGEAMGWGGDWDQSAVIPFSCSLFFSLFSLCSCLLFPLACGPIHGPQFLQEAWFSMCWSTRHKSLQGFACGSVFIYWLQFLQGCYQLYHGAILCAVVPSSISFWCLTSLNMFLQVPPMPWQAQMCPSVTPLEGPEQAVSGIRPLPASSLGCHLCKPHLTANTWIYTNHHLFT